MDTSTFNLKNPPIVEAVIDLDCEMPADFDLAALEASAKDELKPKYPKFRKQFVAEFEVRMTKLSDEATPPPVRKPNLQALQFLQDDDRQLVQFRSTGYSFNRLAPYSGFDKHLPEIQQGWEIFDRLAKPQLLREIRLRYINKMMLPAINGQADLAKYLKIRPTLPDETRLQFTGFLNKHTAEETGTGNKVVIVLASQQQENGKVPVILDISVARAASLKPGAEAWGDIAASLNALRDLKNHLFRRTLTDEWLNSYN